MRLLTFALCTAAAALLYGCSGSNGGSIATVPSADSAQSHYINGHFIPRWSRFASLVPPELRPLGPAAVLAKIAPNSEKKPKGGIYAGEFNGTSILGYTDPNVHNNPPICSVGHLSNVNGIAVDDAGNLIAPDGGTYSVVIFKGPRMCGRKLGSFSDPYGQPADAASANAATGTIVVGNIFDLTGAGSVSVCTLAAGCTANLTNPNIYEVAGVALAGNGDCWASAVNAGGTATLTYFRGCTGSGQLATGYLNASYGGLDIDDHGYLVSISAFNSEYYVYMGCNPACTLVGGPFSLLHQSFFGRLGKNSQIFVAADVELNQIDVYKYTPRTSKHDYSFDNGLTPRDIVEGVAVNPGSTR